MTPISDTAAVSDERLAELIEYTATSTRAWYRGAMHTALRELQRRRAFESDGAGGAVDRWVAWKPGDALPVSGEWFVMRHPPHLFKPARGISEIHGGDCAQAEAAAWRNTGVIAYWSRPLPAPYTPKEPTAVKTAGSESDE